ncbi:MAG: FG-GAP repeat domain-containing protein [Bacteroidota bacterium]
MKHFSIITLVATFLISCSTPKEEQSTPYEIIPVKFNNPGLTVDLGVGLWAWPLPMDYDKDGDMDLIVSCPDKPFNGVYFFENASGETFPDFKPPVRLGDAVRHAQVSYVDGEPRVIISGSELVNFRESLDANPKELFPVDSIIEVLRKDYPEGKYNKTPRFNQWKYVDYENDGDLDLVVGVDDWTDYGWDNAYDENGTWTNGPLYGYVFLIENVEGTYVNKGRLEAGGERINVYGAPTPNFGDFDGDGDLDLICGEFVDRFTWFENIGTREKPEYAKGRFLENERGLVKMDLEMIIPVGLDWDKDGDMDLVVGDEDGRVALVENTGEVAQNMPVFKSPRYFRQEADLLKFGALVTPYSVDWDDDGDDDLICGNTAGYIGFVENLDGNNPPKWAEPTYLEINGSPIRIMAGDNGSIQGPCETKWGYTTLSVADWDGDGLKDVIINSIWGKVEWYKNVGSKGSPQLSEKQSVKVAWEGPAPKPAWTWWEPGPEELAPEWRTIPYAIDWNKDEMMDLVMLDHEGYLTFFERFKKDRDLYLKPGQRIFRNENDEVLRMNVKEAGGSGRRKFTFVDWDQDGDLDMIANSKNVEFLENTGEAGGVATLKNRGDMSDMLLAGHTTSPTVVDWDGNKVPDLLIGAEDGHFYYLKNE